MIFFFFCDLQTIIFLNFSNSDTIPSFVYLFDSFIFTLLCIYHVQDEELLLEFEWSKIKFNEKKTKQNNLLRGTWFFLWMKTIVIHFEFKTSESVCVLAIVLICFGNWRALWLSIRLDNRFQDYSWRLCFYNVINRNSRKNVLKLNLKIRV